MKEEITSIALILLSASLVSAADPDAAKKRHERSALEKREQRMACSTKLSQLGKAFAMYSMDNDERYPDDIGGSFLYLANLKMYVCRSPAGQPNMRKDNIPQWTDYVYFPGLSADSRPDRIVVTCRPEIHDNEGVNVLCVDGSVRWCTLDEFRVALKQQGIRPPALAASDGQADIRKLIAQLGARDFKEREMAESKLLALGNQAVGLLKGAGQHEDPEISARAKVLFEKLKTPESAVSELLLHKSLPGDTLTSVAKLWGVSVKNLAEANGMKDQDPVGQKRLIIPVE